VSSKLRVKIEESMLAVVKIFFEARLCGAKIALVDETD
jgi:hypothetical protein